MTAQNDNENKSVCMAHAPDSISADAHCVHLSIYIWIEKATPCWTESELLAFSLSLSLYLLLSSPPLLCPPPSLSMVFSIRRCVPDSAEWSAHYYCYCCSTPILSKENECDIFLKAHVCVCVCKIEIENNKALLQIQTLPFDYLSTTTRIYAKRWLHDVTRLCRSMFHTSSVVVQIVCCSRIVRKEQSKFFYFFQVFNQSAQISSAMHACAIEIAAEKNETKIQRNRLEWCKKCGRRKHKIISMALFSWLGHSVMLCNIAHAHSLFFHHYGCRSYVRTAKEIETVRKWTKVDAGWIDRCT